MPIIGSPRTETVTLYFPDIVPFQYDYGEEITAVDEINDAWGAEQRMAIVEDRLAFRGSLDYLTLSQRRLIRDFIVNSARMRIKPFYIFAGVAEEYTVFPVGTGNGTATDFVLPFKGGYASMASVPCAVTNVKVNGVLKTLTTDYSISAMQDLETVLTFVSAPGNTLPVTADIVGRPRYPARLAETSQAIKFLPTGDNRGVREISVIEIL